MPIIGLDSVIAVVPVTNQATAVNWYKALLGRDADVIPTEGVAEWELAPGMWLQVTTGPERAGKTTVVLVQALDRCSSANTFDRTPTAEI